MRRAGFVALLALAVLAGAPACRRGATDWRVEQLLGGPGSAEALAQPTAVDVFRIDPAAGPPEPNVPYVGVHRVVAGPFAVAPDVAAELSRILADSATYDWRHAKSDPYRPTYGLRFTRDATKLDIALDFTSSMLTAHRHGRRVGVEDFDAARAQLVAALRRALPDDPELAALR